MLALVALAPLALTVLSTCPKLAQANPLPGPTPTTLGPESNYATGDTPLVRAHVQLARAPAVRAAAVSGLAPLLGSPLAMKVRGGQVADQVMHASDADGDPLTFLKTGGPSYMTVGTIDPGAGSATANIHLAPAVTDAGETTGRVSVTDGSLSDAKSFSIVVFPILDQPADMEVDEGDTADQTLTASEPESFTFALVSGPEFVTVTTTSDTTGSVHLAPGFTDAGSFRATLSVTNGVATDEKSFQITVKDVNAQPEMAQPADMHATPGTETNQLLTASDPDGQSLTFSKLSGPSYMYVGTLGSTPPRGYAHLIPANRDTGVVVATVAVTDGTASDQKSFTIRVDFAYSAPALTQPEDMDIAEGAVQDQLVCASDPDGQTLSLYAWSEPRFMSVTTVRQTLGSDSVFGRIRLIPTYEDAGTYRPTLVVSDGWWRDTKSFNITVRDAHLNHPPVPRSGGPYDGTVGVPIPFTAAGSVDPDGDPLAYLWSFGDGAGADGPAVVHTYSAIGAYAVSLLVSDGNLSASDVTQAIISEADVARVFVVGRAGPLRLEAGSARFCVALEVGATVRRREDVYLASIRMRADGLGETSTIVADSASVVVGDSDRNGVPDITACFSRGDLRRLFASVTGRVSTAASIEVSLRDGHGARDLLSLDVIGPDGRLSVLVAPNPINPLGTFSFVTAGWGMVRLSLFDNRGRLVRTLFDAASMAPGFHDVWIDGRSDNGTQLSSGIYYYRLETVEGNRTGRIAIVR